MKSRARPGWSARAVMASITAYQRVMAGTVSRCRFAPSCSEYTHEAIETFGLTRGGWMGVRRIGRCHPWHPGGYEPVRDPNTSSTVGR